MIALRPFAARAALATTALMLAACDSASSGGPGAVSEGEARALDEAAEMLEAERLPEGVLPQTGADGAVASEQAGEAEETADQ